MDMPAKGAVKRVEKQKEGGNHTLVRDTLVEVRGNREHRSPGLSATVAAPLF